MRSTSWAGGWPRPARVSMPPPTPSFHRGFREITKGGKKASAPDCHPGQRHSSWLLHRGGCRRPPSPSTLALILHMARGAPVSSRLLVLGSHQGALQESPRLSVSERAGGKGEIGARGPPPPLFWAHHPSNLPGFFNFVVGPHWNL